MNKFLFLILFSPAVLAQSFIDVKKLADEHESALVAEEKKTLISAQGKLASNAFGFCFNQTRQQPGNFVVVVRIGSNGTVEKSWLKKGGNAFAQCFKEQMHKHLYYVPKKAPFYSSFDYTQS